MPTAGSGNAGDRQKNSSIVYEWEEANLSGRSKSACDSEHQNRRN